MSKASRKRRKDSRLEIKKRKKAARAELYAKFAEEGKQKESGRSFRNRKKTLKDKSQSHGAANCGNPACRKCNKLTFSGFLKKVGNIMVPFEMPHWMYLRWINNQVTI